MKFYKNSRRVHYFEHGVMRFLCYLYKLKAYFFGIKFSKIIFCAFLRAEFAVS